MSVLCQWIFLSNQIREGPRAEAKPSLVIRTLDSEKWSDTIHIQYVSSTRPVGPFCPPRILLLDFDQAAGMDGRAKEPFGTSITTLSKANVPFIAGNQRGYLASLAQRNAQRRIDSQSPFDIIASAH